MSNLSTRFLLILTIVVAACSLAFSQTTPQRQRNYPAPVEGDFTIKDFKFRSSETINDLCNPWMVLQKGNFMRPIGQIILHCLTRHASVAVVSNHDLEPV